MLLGKSGISIQVSKGYWESESQNLLRKAEIEIPGSAVQTLTPPQSEGNDGVTGLKLGRDETILRLGGEKREDLSDRRNQFGVGWIFFAFHGWMVLSVSDKVEGLGRVER